MSEQVITGEAVAAEIKTMTCDKHGEYEAKVIRILSSDHVSGCPKCEEERLASEEALAKARKAERADRTVASVVPPRFAGCSLDGYHAETPEQRRALAICRKYADNWPSRLAAGGCLVMCGRPGTGKTHLALAVASDVIRQSTDDGAVFDTPPPVIYSTAMQLTRAVKSTYAKDSHETESSVIKRYSRTPLLVIDEVGGNRNTESELLILQEIIDNRYQRMLPTIMISNLPENELADYIGERALDRMYENGGAVIAFDWESYRRAK